MLSSVTMAPDVIAYWCGCLCRPAKAANPVRSTAMLAYSVYLCARALMSAYLQRLKFEDCRRLRKIAIHSSVCAKQTTMFVLLCRCVCVVYVWFTATETCCTYVRSLLNNPMIIQSLNKHWQDQTFSHEHTSVSHFVLTKFDSMIQRWQNQSFITHTQKLPTHYHQTKPNTALNTNTHKMNTANLFRAFIRTLLICTCSASRTQSLSRKTPEQVYSNRPARTRRYNPYHLLAQDNPYLSRWTVAALRQFISFARTHKQPPAFRRGQI